MSEDNLCHLISPVIADELRISPDADVECVLTVRCRTVAALARRVLRVSASARRAAAAYGNALWLLSEARTLISLLVFGGSAAELAVDMARFCVRHNGAKSSVWFGHPPLPPKSDLFKWSGPLRTRHPGPLVATLGAVVP